MVHRIIKPRIICRLQSQETQRKRAKAQYFIDNTDLPNKKDISPEYWKFRSKEFRGDALLKFLVSEILLRIFPDAKTQYFIPVVDSIISNSNLISVAQKLKLEPFEEDMKFYTARLKKGIAYANAFEAHLWDLYETGDLVEAKLFIIQHMFTKPQIEKYAKRIK